MSFFSVNDHVLIIPVETPKTYKYSLVMLFFLFFFLSISNHSSDQHFAHISYDVISFSSKKIVKLVKYFIVSPHNIR